MNTLVEFQKKHNISSAQLLIWFDMWAPFSDKQDIMDTLADEFDLPESLDANVYDYAINSKLNLDEVVSLLPICANEEYIDEFIEALVFGYNGLPALCKDWDPSEYDDCDPRDSDPEEASPYDFSDAESEEDYLHYND